MDLFNDNIRVAKKEHKCLLCNLQIKAGEEYHRQNGKFEDEFFDRCLHMVCDNIAIAYCDEFSFREFKVDDVHDWLKDGFCHDCLQCDVCKKNLFECETITKSFENYKKGAKI